ncbi:protein FAM171B [Electrophorus electricus]|uniref:protein FAM171B n=1 Tax=Electrophorus electricus TaxID=8005 RepID=UPI0015D0CCCD|nr:protein FAM171B [Electrophorus electricus]
MPCLAAHLLLSAPLLLLLLREAGALRAARGGLHPPGLASPSEHNDIDAQASAHRGRQDGTTEPPEPSSLTLKVSVKDASSQRFLSGAAVLVFVNGSRLRSSRTQDGGEVLLTVPYQLGATLTLVASMDAYVPSQFRWKTTKMPIFSSVTMSLLPQTQGNIWLFEDNVLITRKTADLSSQPNVQFPKDLISLPENTTISMVTAYLTVTATPPEKDSHFSTLGVVNNKGGYKSVKLSPVAVLSAQLLSGGKQLDVSGPVQITVPLPYHTRLRASDTLPAWAFDMTTGTWVNKGIGSVKMGKNGLVWTYVAPHLGYWMAASSPMSNGYMGHAASMDFISYHTYLLVGILGGTLVIIIGFLSVILCHCRDLSHEVERKRWNSTRLSVLKKDQMTSTTLDEARGPLYHNGDRTYSRAVGHPDASASPRHQASYNIYIENVCRPGGNLYENTGSAGLENLRPPVSNLYVNGEEAARLREISEKSGSRQAPEENVVYRDKLFHIYNQPVAIVQTPELFGAQVQADSAGNRSATFPRNGLEHGAQTERNFKDSFTQTLPKVPQQDSEDRAALEGPPTSTANPGIWGRYSHLLESVSVPGTLNEAAGMGPFHSDLQGVSEQTLLELSKAKPSPHPPRAWFVSLDGKPAAQVRHSVIELQGRHRPGSSNDTSLDSGVDMNELQQSLRKSEREGPSVASMPKAAGGRGQEEHDLSSSEIGSPEDASLRNTLEGSSAAIPNIPEDRDAGDTSSESRSTPPPRRLRKVRDKRPDKKTSRHVRDERPQTKR